MESLGFLTVPFLCRERKVVKFKEMPLDSEHRQETCCFLSDEEEELLVWASKRPLHLRGVKITLCSPNSGELVAYKFLGDYQKGIGRTHLLQWAADSTGAQEEDTQCSVASKLMH